MTGYYRFTVFAATGVALIALVMTPAFGLLADEEEVDLIGAHVAVLVGEGVHDLETLVPMAYLANRGARVTVVGIERGSVNAYNSDITIQVQRTVDFVTADEFDALVIPGGESPSVLREHEGAVQFAADFVNAGKVTAAICHGPQVLITAGVLDGREATGVRGIADELTDAGAVFEDASVIRDDNLITSRVPDDLPDFCKAIQDALADEVDLQPDWEPEPIDEIDLDDFPEPDIEPLPDPDVEPLPEPMPEPDPEPFS